MWEAISQLTGGFLCADDCARAEQVSSAKLDVLSDHIDASVQEGQKLVVIARSIAGHSAHFFILSDVNLRKILDSTFAQIKKVVLFNDGRIEIEIEDAA